MGAAGDQHYGPRHVLQGSSCRYHWPDENEYVGWPAVARKILEGDGPAQALCIVNVKRHATELFEVLRDSGAALHLSTAMCPTHRRLVIDEITRRLNEGRECVVAATQCVEAGVDLDFPRVFRALAPLDAIAQAAGRCNRNKRCTKGDVYIFRPEEEAQRPGRVYPGRAYQSAAELAWRMRHRDLHCPQTFTDYYRELYAARGLQRTGHGHPLSKLELAIRRFHYEDVARLYKIIDQEQVNVLVPWREGAQLADEVRNSCLSGAWVRAARPFSVNVHADLVRDPETSEFFDSVAVKRGGTALDWFLLRTVEHYSEEVGLRIPKERTGMYQV